MRWLARWLRTNAQRRSVRRDTVVFGALVMHARLGGTPFLYATELWQRLGGSSADVYASLWALERSGFVVAQWDDSEPLPRRQYAVAPDCRPAVLR